MHHINDHQVIERIWYERINGKHVYRGMNEYDLTFPLDPRQKLYKNQKQLITGFLDILDKLLASGLSFQIIERHWSKEYRHNPADISRWTRRDLDRTGIDFTSNYQSAKEYSDCLHGSQLKQNLKSISDFLYAHEMQISNSYNITKHEWDTIKAVNDWINTECQVKPVIVHILRELDVFRKEEQILPLGTKEGFKNDVISRFAHNINYSFLLTQLPDQSSEFYCSLNQPLNERDIFKIERM